MLLEVKNLSIYYYTLAGVVKGAENVTFSIGRGEWVTFVGESGSGKSTVAHAIMNIVPSQGKIVSGEVIFEGKDLLKVGKEELRKIRGKDISMIFQDPMTSLDPLRKVGDQMVEVMTVHGVSEDEARERAKELLEKVNLPPDRLDYYPHQLSGGQRQRVVIARAMVLKPEFVVADEAVSMIDVSMRASILELLESFREEYNLSQLFITHDIAVGKLIADRIAVMYLGKIVEIGPTDEVLKNPAHPYTMALIQAVPSIARRKKEKKLKITGEVPNAANPPNGCRFHPRCPFSSETCIAHEPELVEIGHNHFVACHHPLH
ncbi:hypothetical protein APY94_00685 [Thermococcus celericrescens]|uniref:ABC transporter domain-containing protein n=1 Tax=Thermococcus celericrescens TaxID=227598 RepID=A0A100XZR8_9EURY|nr:ABC transporter ATP-binding protein [Thermococcus celericrescens]KUH34731.1 hypothetical protein APY94_00685 [Thermococcus celericrescens]